MSKTPATPEQIARIAMLYGTERLRQDPCYVPVAITAIEMAQVIDAWRVAFATVLDP